MKLRIKETTNMMCDYDGYDNVTIIPRIGEKIVYNGSGAKMFIVDDVQIDYMCDTVYIYVTKITKNGGYYANNRNL